MPTPKLSPSSSATSTPPSLHPSSKSAQPQTRLRPSSLLSNARPSALRGDDTRRAGHGGHPWSLPFSARQKMQFQPQDGAISTTSKLTNIAARLHGSLAQEPEDARLTGGTRSLTRRLLGLNVTTLSRKSPHATDLATGLPIVVQVA